MPDPEPPIDGGADEMVEVLDRRKQIRSNRRDSLSLLNMCMQEHVWITLTDEARDAVSGVLVQSCKFLGQTTWED